MNLQCLKQEPHGVTSQQPVFFISNVASRRKERCKALIYVSDGYSERLPTYLGPYIPVITDAKKQ
jgi:hypothetical protein